MFKFNNQATDNKKNIKKILALFIGILLIAGSFFNLIWFKKYLPWRTATTAESNKSSGLHQILIKPVSAKDIYPLFICPCCGKTIDAGCCGMAKERMLFLEGLTTGKLTEDEIISAYVKKYGLNSFKDKNKQTEFKQQLIQQAPADRPIIAASPDSYDLGDVSQKKGTVSTMFTVKNEGKTDLIINKLATSCGCTSALIIYNDKEGPIFSMPGHGVNEKIEDWQVVIPAGDAAQLKVYYDPNMHKDFRGQAIREIYIYSNDPINFEAKVKIELNQVD